jgi:hypothetical protein
MNLQSPSVVPSLLLQKSIKARQDAISNKLADPSQIPSIHPLIYRTEITSRRKEGTIEAIAFDIWEKVPLFGLSIPSRYRGEVRRDLSSPALVLLEAWSQPGIHFLIHFRIEESSADQCQVKEDVWIEAPWLLRSFLQKTVSAAHQTQLSNLDASFAAQTSR